MAEKPVKAKQPEKVKAAESARMPVKAAPEKPKEIKVKAPEKEKKEDKDKAQPKKPNRLQLWWRETIGELRKVSWPTMPDARRLTTIVLVVVAITSIFLGLMDLIFSKLIGLLVTL